VKTERNHIYTKTFEWFGKLKMITFMACHFIHRMQCLYGNSLGTGEASRAKNFGIVRSDQWRHVGLRNAL